MALERPAQISLETWLREEATLPEGSFVALAGGEIVGWSGLVQHDNDGVAEDGLTVVRRDWRHARARHDAQANGARLGCRTRFSRGRDLDAAGKRGNAQHQ